MKAKLPHLEKFLGGYKVKNGSDFVKVSIRINSVVHSKTMTYKYYCILQTVGVIVGIEVRLEEDTTKEEQGPEPPLEEGHW